MPRAEESRQVVLDGHLLERVRDALARESPEARSGKASLWVTAALREWLEIRAIAPLSGSADSRQDSSTSELEEIGRTVAAVATKLDKIESLLESAVPAGILKDGPFPGEILQSWNLPDQERNLLRILRGLADGSSFGSPGRPETGPAGQKKLGRLMRCSPPLVGRLLHVLTERRFIEKAEERRGTRGPRYRILAGGLHDPSGNQGP